MRGAIVAERDGFFASYVDTVYRSLWSESAKMDEPDVIRAVLEAAGLDAELILRGTQDPAIKQKLVANTEAAVSRGVFGSPSFFVGDELFFGKDRLPDVEREIDRQR